MMEWKQSTALSWDIWMADSADGKTGKTGLTLAVTLAKYGDTSFSSIAPTVTEIGGGHYKTDLTTTHMNTLGPANARATSAGADPADMPNFVNVIALDKQDVVRGGLTALPNVAAGSLGGLRTDGIRTGTAQGGGTGSNQIQLDAGASATDAFYNRCKVSITGGTGAGQSRHVIAYVGATKTATVNRNWTTNPDATSVFAIVAESFPVLTEGLAQAGAASTVTLQSTASAVDDFYKGLWLELVSGTGAGQSRLCTAYNGTTKVATVARAWATNPDSTTGYQAHMGAGVDVASWAATAVAAPTVAGIPKVEDATLQARLTAPRAVLLDNLDATVSSRLAPTVAARTLDVSAGGEAGIDWANVGSPATAVNLSNTTIATVSGVNNAAIAAAVWAVVSEGTSTVLQVFRLLTGILSGTATFTAGVLTFWNLDHSKIRATITVDGTGRPNLVLGDLS